VQFSKCTKSPHGKWLNWDHLGPDFIFIQKLQPLFQPVGINPTARPDANIPAQGLRILLTLPQAGLYFGF